MLTAEQLIGMIRVKLPKNGKKNQFQVYLLWDFCLFLVD